MRLSPRASPHRYRPVNCADPLDLRSRQSPIRQGGKVSVAGVSKYPPGGGGHDGYQFTSKAAGSSLSARTRQPLVRAKLIHSRDDLLRDDASNTRVLSLHY